MEHQPETERRTFFAKTMAFLAGAVFFSGLSKTANAISKPQFQPQISSRAMRSSDSPFVGEIALYPYNFAPYGWLECNGQLLPISEYETLFVLIGTTYGGDGQSTFALPDLQGRVVVHQGTGSGLSSKSLGETGGSEEVTLSSTQIPSHSHSVSVYSGAGNSDSPNNTVIASDRDGTKHFSSAVPDVSEKTSSIVNTGGSQPHNNMAPYLGLRYCISVFGIFPSQS